MKHIRVDPKIVSSKIVTKALGGIQPTLSDCPPFGLVPLWERDGNLILCRLIKDGIEYSWGWAKRNPSKDADSPTVGKHIAYNRALEKFIKRDVIIYDAGKAE